MKEEKNKAIATEKQISNQKKQNFNDQINKEKSSFLKDSNLKEVKIEKPSHSFFRDKDDDEDILDLNKNYYKGTTSKPIENPRSIHASNKLTLEKKDDDKLNDLRKKDNLFSIKDEKKTNDSKNFLVDSSPEKKKPGPDNKTKDIFEQNFLKDPKNELKDLKKENSQKTDKYGFNLHEKEERNDDLFNKSNNANKLDSFDNLKGIQSKSPFNNEEKKSHDFNYFDKTSNSKSKPNKLFLEEPKKDNFADSFKPNLFENAKNYENKAVFNDQPKNIADNSFGINLFEKTKPSSKTISTLPPLENKKVSSPKKNKEKEDFETLTKNKDPQNVFPQKSNIPSFLPEEKKIVPKSKVEESIPKKKESDIFDDFDDLLGELETTPHEKTNKAEQEKKKSLEKIGSSDFDIENKPKVTFIHSVEDLSKTEVGNEKKKRK